MKKFLVVLLALAMVFGLGSVAFAADTQIADYTDLAGVPAEQQAAIYRLTALGVLAGDGIGGDFRPEDTITRAEFAKIAIYLAGKADAVDLYASFAPAFADVQDGTWYEGYVNAAVAFGYMKGYADDTFKPGQTVTMQEVATVLLRIAGYTDALKGEWPNDYIRKANDTEIIAYVDFVGPKAATRAEVASLANEVLDLEMVQLIENEVAAGLGQLINYVDGIGVDEDGFAYLKDKTNEDGDVFGFITVLEYAFDATTVKVAFDVPDDGVLIEATGWHFGDFEDGEIELDTAYLWDADDEDYDATTGNYELADEYYIMGSIYAVAGQMVELTVTLDSDNEYDEVLFGEVLSTRVAYDELEDGEYDGEEYKDSTEADYGDVGGAYGYIFLDEAGKLYAGIDMTAYEWATEWDLVKELEDDELTGKDVATNKLDYDVEDDDDFVLFVKDGEVIAADELEENDVVIYAGTEITNDEDANVPMWIVKSLIEGEVDKLYTKTAKEIKVDGVDYAYASKADNADGAAIFTKDNADKDFDTYATYGDLRAEEIVDVIYLPGYAWQTLDLIGVNEGDSDFYAIVLGYEAGRKVIGVNDGDKYVDVEEEITAIIVLSENGEELTIDIEDVEDIDLYNLTNEDDEEVLPELGDAIEIVLNKDGEITDITLMMPYGTAEEREAVGTQVLTGSIEIKANGRVKVGSDWLKIDEDTVIAGIYSEDDCCDGTPHYEWDCFEKAEILDVNDILGTTMEFDYAAAIQATGSVHVDYIFVVDPEGANKGDYTFDIAAGHYYSNKANTDYIELFDGDLLTINEDAAEEDTFYNAIIDDDVIYPMVVLYCLDDEELTNVVVPGDVATRIIDDEDVIKKGDIIPVLNEDGLVKDAANSDAVFSADEITALLNEYFDVDEDDDITYSVVVADTDAATSTIDAELDDALNFVDVLTSTSYTVFFDGMEIVDLTDDCDTVTFKRAVTKDDYENHNIYMIIATEDGEDTVVAAYLCK